MWTSGDGVTFMLRDGVPALESDGRIGRTEMNAAAPVGDAFVGVGAVTPPNSPLAARDPIAWTSVDGASWRRIAFPHTASDDSLLSVGQLDWEWASAGDFVDDLAWCEWIIRIHHPEHLDALGELFHAYGVYPSWTQRHSAMVRKMQSLLAFSERRDPDDLDSRTNRARLAATEAFTE